MLALDQFGQPGGGQQVLFELLSAARRLGWDALVGLPGDGPMLGRLRGIGCATFAIGRGRSDAARYAGETASIARSVRDAVQQFRPDVVYVNGPRLLPAAAIARIPVPVVFHSHSLVPSGVARWAAGLALRSLRAHITAVSMFTAAQWRTFVPPDRVRVVYNGVPDLAGRGAREPGPPRIGCIGRISPEKGQLDFIRAARLIHRESPHCRFVVVGGPLFQDPASCRYELAVRAEAVGLPVEFRGWSDRPAAEIRRLDLLLVPSGPQEAVTRVIPEGWSAGVPVIAFASGGIPEIVRDGVNGRLVRSVGEMVEHAIHLLGPAAHEQAKLSAGGRATWERDFRLELAQQLWLEAVVNAVAGRSATTERRTRQHGPPQPRESSLFPP